MDTLRKIIAARDAGQLEFSEVEPPGWLFESIDWFGQPPTVLVSNQKFENFGGVALRQANEIVIFDQPDIQTTAEIVLAHEAAHFMTPLHAPGHGVHFLIQFGYLLAHFRELDEVEPLLTDCVDYNWNRFCPQFLKKKAAKMALKIVLEGGPLPRREAGWIHLFSGRIGGQLHRKTALFIAQVAAAGGLSGFLFGLPAGIAACCIVTVAGLL
jgi:hypothetical protein